MKTKCSLQARIPYLWHANASSFLIIPQVVALETAKQLLDLRDPAWESKKPLQPQHSDPWRLQRYGRRTVRKTWKRGRKWTKLSYIAQFFKNTKRFLWITPSLQMEGRLYPSGSLPAQRFTLERTALKCWCRRSSLAQLSRSGNSRFSSAPTDFPQCLVKLPEIQCYCFSLNKNRVNYK